MAFYPIDYSEPKNTCTICGTLWEGNPFEYETDNHEFPCPECAAQQSFAPDPETEVLFHRGYFFVRTWMD